jgi:hypothetical protein
VARHGRLDSGRSALQQATDADYRYVGIDMTDLTVEETVRRIKNALPEVYRQQQQPDDRSVLPPTRHPQDRNEFAIHPREADNLHTRPERGGLESKGCQQWRRECRANGTTRQAHS